MSPGEMPKKTAGRLGNNDLSPVAHLGGAKDTVFAHPQIMLSTRHHKTPFIIFFTQMGIIANRAKNGKRQIRSEAQGRVMNIL